ncbi:P-loop containing nucleoside triphosphate hydrolase [Gracilaria domingensis]|nr:P-loop containing nucleoside triphosphate hydrolase [Gracilaria domingensis]
MIISHSLPFVTWWSLPPLANGWNGCLMLKLYALLTARMLRIERVLDTIVGNNILRGLSGGQRTRTTIAEMLIGMNAGVVVRDNWSEGLDSSTTLSITKSMREFADTSESPVITSMQAPGTDVYNFFDTVGPRTGSRNLLWTLVRSGELF